MQTARLEAILPRLTPMMLALGGFVTRVGPWMIRGRTHLTMKIDGTA